MCLKEDRYAPVYSEVDIQSRVGQGVAITLIRSFKVAQSVIMVRGLLMSLHTYHYSWQRHTRIRSPPDIEMFKCG